MSSQLTANFNESEFFVHEAPPDVYVSSTLPRVAELAQWLRDLAGSWAIVTSYWRSPAHNKEVGGASGSQHLVGEAVDLNFPFVSLRELAARVQAAVADSSAPAFGQVIFYQDTGEVHISLPGASHYQEILLGSQASSGGVYSALSSPSELPAVPRAANYALWAILGGIILAVFAKLAGRSSR